MLVYILRGVSGSGKTTFMDKVLRGKHKNLWDCSADDYFVGQDGQYRFDPTKLSEAHNKCKRDFVDMLIQGSGMQDEDLALVVDNTNLRASEYGFYPSTAKIYGCRFLIVNFLVDPEIAWKRNVHGVPEHTVRQIMAERFEKGTYDIPDYWPQVFIIQ